MKKTLLFLIALVLLSGTLFADDLKEFPQQKIICSKTSENIVIDGVFDSAWNNAKSYSMYAVTTDKAPLTAGTVRTMYDNENIYVILKAVDKDIFAYETKTDGTTCLDDVLEIFLRPGKTCPWYYNAEINALGTAYTGKNHVGGGGGSARWGHLWNPDLDYKVKITGTINNPNDIDKYWILEAKIPFATLDVLKGKTPKAGDVWYCNFAKYDYSIYLPASMNGMELATVCHTNNVAFHELINYCPLVFGK